MFQPTNESFVSSVVEETLTRYQESTDDDHIPLSQDTYHPSRLYQMLCLASYAVGRLLEKLGQHMEELDVPEISLRSKNSHVGIRPATHHAH